MNRPSSARRLAATLALALASPHALPRDLAVESKASSCNACHGPGGRSVAGIPALAGRPAEQLYETLLAFKNNRRPTLVMHQHAKGYSDAELRAIAEFFARQRAEGQP
ncbi:MAG: hypothetical protein OHK0044_24430 [Burkholderiaceae bacterium]